MGDEIESFDDQNEEDELEEAGMHIEGDDEESSDSDEDM